MRKLLTLVIVTLASFLAVPSIHAQCGLLNDSARHVPTDYAAVADPHYSGSFFAPPNTVAATFADSLSSCTITQLSYGFSQYGKAVRHEYSNMTAINSDDTLIELLTSSGDWYVTDMAGNVVVPVGNVPFSGGIGGRWAVSDPLTLYYINQDAKLHKAVVPSNFNSCKPSCTVSNSVVHDFSGSYIASTNGFSFGGGEGDLQTSQPNLILLCGVRTGGSASSPCNASSGGADVFIYNIQTDTPGTALDIGTHNMDTAMLTADGRFVVNWGSNGSSQCVSGPCFYGFELFDGSGAYVRSLHYKHSHSKPGVYNGTNYLFFIDTWPLICTQQGVVAQNIDTGTTSCILDVLPWNASIHLGASEDGSGWLVVDHIDYESSGAGSYPLATNWNLNVNGSGVPTSSGYWGVYTEEEILLRSDGSSVYRMTWNRSRASGSSYWKQPRSSISRDAKFVIYDSDYGQGVNTPATDYTDVFLIATGIISGGAAYYVDFATGADTNNGTAKGTPWKHANGMQGCASTCASTVPAAGDSVIFKGGVTWDSTCWSWVLPSSGAVGNPIYYGVDLTWFAGGSFTQPVFDAAGTTPTAISMLRILSVSNLTFDNFEMKNLLFTTANGGAFFHLDTAGNILMERLYLHGWDVTTANDDAHGAVYVSPAVPGSPNIVDHTTISNTEFSATHNNGVAITAADVVSFSTIHDVPSFCLGCGTVHDSVIYGISYPVHDFDGAYHTNGHYMIGAGAADYNNLYYNFEANAAPIYPNIGSGGAGACQDWTQYIYNNVVILAGQAVPIAIDVNPEISTGAGFCGSAYVMNNTIQSDSDISAIRSAEWTNGDGNVFVKNLTVRNNHVINSTGANTFCFTTGGGCGAPQTLADTNSVFQTNANATSQGYTSGNQYRPTGPGGITVAAGLNLFSLGISTLDADKLGVPRPSAAAWDDGAYEYFGANGLRRGATAKPGTKIH